MYKERNKKNKKKDMAKCKKLLEKCAEGIYADAIK